MKQTGRPARSREGYHWFRGWRKPTAAQRRVLDELVAGGTNAQIATRLGISEDGVKWHLSELRDEIGLSDRRELAEWWTEERQRGGVNVLAPLAGLWRLVARNAVPAVAVAGFVAASLAIGWFAYDGLRGDDDATASGAAPPRTPSPAAVVPFVPTPKPTPPSPQGALLFDVTTGEARILPGDYIDRRWLDTEALTFIVSNRGRPAVIDADGEVQVISNRTTVGYYPLPDEGKVMLWGWNDGLVSVVDMETGEEAQLGDFGSDPTGARREDVSGLAGKVALSEEPYAEVTVYDLVGSNPRQVYIAKPDEPVSYLRWSPDGQWLLIVVVKEEDGTRHERSLVFDADGASVLQLDSGANWAGAQTLRLRNRDDLPSGGGPLITDALVDVVHGSEIPFPEGTLICVSPDSRYAITAEATSATFNAPTEHRLHDLVTGDILAGTVVNGFLVNCDWTPDGGKVVLSPAGGK